MGVSLFEATISCPFKAKPMEQQRHQRHPYGITDFGRLGLLAKWLDGQTNLQGIGAVAARVKAETRAHED